MFMVREEIKNKDSFNVPKNFIECFGFSYENQCSFLVGVMKHQISCSDFTDYIGNVAANYTGALGPGGGTEEE